MTLSFFYIDSRTRLILQLLLDTSCLAHSNISQHLVFVERELANLPRTLATDTLPKFFNDFTRVASTL